MTGLNRLMGFKLFPFDKWIFNDNTYIYISKRPHKYAKLVRNRQYAVSSKQYTVVCGIPYKLQDRIISLRG